MKKERYYFSDVDIDEYLDFRAKKLHNALFSYEESNLSAFKNIHTILLEFESLGEYLPFLKRNSQFTSLLLTLEFLYDEFILMDNNHEVVKREVFKCMNIIKYLRTSLPQLMECD
ncbi:hypothetical protein PQ478_08475 [Alkalihalophilus pseudofirmus]|uniref:hypothetical protein n=1 Tax=Alkalihalophilus pseudofirmus TaxID=79885 RepID=UPI00259B5209|nr:hypothetical protein [Alkalihalophilus pseudofirmus]WEG18503.1 hypothetical protein PQ478_08475 [Alkalihalophilus pseudofirmus]